MKNFEKVVRAVFSKAASKRILEASNLVIPKKTFSSASSASFETKPFKLHKLTEGPSSSVTVSSEDALQYYRQMSTIRALEITVDKFSAEKGTVGFFHTCSGQEAISVGMKAALRPQDNVVAAYRIHGWVYVMGTSTDALMAEIVGKRTGPQRGKGGSMHLYCKHFFGGNGLVGAQVPLGVGIGLEARYNKTGGVSVACYGDGAANQGQVFEAYNIAKLWNLPCIFVCENNGYAMFTKNERGAANPKYYTKGDYVPGLWVDGMDVLAVREAARYAIDHCTSGKGPIILEAATYRYSGHYSLDPGLAYRSVEEIEEVKRVRDPITNFKSKILASGLVQEQKLQEIDTQVNEEIVSAMAKARQEPETGEDDLAGDVYANCTESKIRGVLPWYQIQHNRIGTPMVSRDWYYNCPDYVAEHLQLGKTAIEFSDPKEHNRPTANKHSLTNG